MGCTASAPGRQVASPDSRKGVASPDGSLGATREPQPAGPDPPAFEVASGDSAAASASRRQDAAKRARRRAAQEEALFESLWSAFSGTKASLTEEGARRLFKATGPGFQLKAQNLWHQLCWELGVLPELGIPKETLRRALSGSQRRWLRQTCARALEQPGVGSELVFEGLYCDPSDLHGSAFQVSVRCADFTERKGKLHFTLLRPSAGYRAGQVATESIDGQWEGSWGILSGCWGTFFGHGKELNLPVRQLGEGYKIQFAHDEVRLSDHSGFTLRLRPRRNSTKQGEDGGRQAYITEETEEVEDDLFSVSEDGEHMAPLPSAKQKPWKRKTARGGLVYDLRYQRLPEEIRVKRVPAGSVAPAFEDQGPSIGSALRLPAKAYLRVSLKGMEIPKTAVEAPQEGGKRKTSLVSRDHKDAFLHEQHQEGPKGLDGYTVTVDLCAQSVMDAFTIFQASWPTPPHASSEVEVDKDGLLRSSGLKPPAEAEDSKARPLPVRRGTRKFVRVAVTCGQGSAAIYVDGELTVEGVMLDPSVWRLGDGLFLFAASDAERMPGGVLVLRVQIDPVKLSREDVLSEHQAGLEPLVRQGQLATEEHHWSSLVLRPITSRPEPVWRHPAVISHFCAGWCIPNSDSSFNLSAEILDLALQRMLTERELLRDFTNSERSQIQKLDRIFQVRSRKPSHDARPPFGVLLRNLARDDKAAFLKNIAATRNSLPEGAAMAVPLSQNIILLLECLNKTTWRVIVCNTGATCWWQGQSAASHPKVKVKTAMLLEDVPRERIQDEGWWTVAVAAGTHAETMLVSHLLPWLAGKPLHPASASSAAAKALDFRTAPHDCAHRTLLDALRSTLRVHFRWGRPKVKLFTLRLREALLDLVKDDLSSVDHLTPDDRAIIDRICQHFALAVAKGAENEGGALEWMDGRKNERRLGQALAAVEQIRQLATSLPPPLRAVEDNLWDGRQEPLDLDTGHILSHSGRCEGPIDWDLFPFFDRFARGDQDITGLEGAKEEKKELSPICYSDLPVKVTHLADAATFAPGEGGGSGGHGHAAAAATVWNVVGRCELLCERLEREGNQHLAKFAFLIQVFTELLPVPWGPISLAAGRGPCIWNSTSLGRTSNPLPRQLQVNLCASIQRLATHLAASSTWIDGDESFQVSRAVALGAMVAMVDALLRREPTGGTSPVTSALRAGSNGESLSVSWRAFLKFTECRQLRSPALAATRSRVLAYFQEQQVPESRCLWSFEKGWLERDEVSEELSRRISGLGSRSAGMVSAYVDDHFPELAAFRNTATWWKFSLFRPGVLQLSLKAGLNLKWRLGTRQKEGDSYVVHLEDQELILRQADEAGLSFAQPEAIAGAVVRSEEDVLHVPKLPEFDGFLGQADVELLSSFLTVPYLRIPLVLNFFAAENRIRSLRHPSLRNCLTDVILEPGPYLAPYQSREVPQRVPCLKKELLGTSAGLLLNEIHQSPQAIAGALIKLFEAALRWGGANPRGEAVEVVLLMIRLAAYFQMSAQLLIRVSQKQHPIIQPEDFRVGEGDTLTSAQVQDIRSAISELQARLQEAARLLNHWLVQVGNSGSGVPAEGMVVKGAGDPHVDGWYEKVNTERPGLPNFRKHDNKDAVIVCAESAMHVCRQGHAGGRSLYVSQQLPHQVQSGCGWDCVEGASPAPSVLLATEYDAQLLSALHTHRLLLLRLEPKMSKDIAARALTSYIFLTRRQQPPSSTFAHIGELEIQEIMQDLRRPLIRWLSADERAYTEFAEVLDAVYRASTNEEAPPRNLLWSKVMGPDQEGRYVAIPRWDDATQDSEGGKATTSVQTSGPKWVLSTSDLRGAATSVEFSLQTFSLRKMGASVDMLDSKITSDRDVSDFLHSLGPLKCKAVGSFAQREDWLVSGGDGDEVLVHMWEPLEPPNDLPLLLAERGYDKHNVVESETWVTELLEPFRNKWLPHPPLDIEFYFHASEPLPGDAHMAVLSAVSKDRPDRVWKEVVLYRDLHLVQVFGFVSHGRRWFRRLEYTSDGQLALYNMQPATVGPLWGRREAASQAFTDSLQQQARMQPKAAGIPSAGIIRDRRVATGSTGFAREEFIPIRLLTGLLPACLLDRFYFWQASHTIYGTPRDGSSEARLIVALIRVKKLFEFIGGSEPRQPEPVYARVHAFFGEKWHTLLNPITARKGTPLHAVAQLFGRVEGLAYILAWAELENEPDPSQGEGLPLKLAKVELPRLGLTFTVQEAPEGTGMRLICPDLGGLYIPEISMPDDVQPFIREIPHALVLATPNRSLRVLVPNLLVVRAPGSTAFSKDVVVERWSAAGQAWCCRAQAKFFMYQVHVSGTILQPPSQAAKLYLLLLRFLYGDYAGATDLATTLSFDTRLTADERQGFIALGDVPDDYCDANAVRCRLSWIVAQATVELPALWDRRTELFHYLGKLSHVSARCRLSLEEEKDLHNAIAIQDMKWAVTKLSLSNHGLLLDDGGSVKWASAGPTLAEIKETLRAEGLPVSTDEVRWLAEQVRNGTDLVSKSVQESLSTRRKVLEAVLSVAGADGTQVECPGRPLPPRLGTWMHHRNYAAIRPEYLDEGWREVQVVPCAKVLSRKSAIALAEDYCRGVALPVEFLHLYWLFARTTRVDFSVTVAEGATPTSVSEKDQVQWQHSYARLLTCLVPEAFGRGALASLVSTLGKCGSLLVATAVSLPRLEDLATDRAEGSQVAQMAALHQVKGWLAQHRQELAAIAIAAADAVGTGFGRSRRPESVEHAASLPLNSRVLPDGRGTGTQTSLSLSASPLTHTYTVGDRVEVRDVKIENWRQGRVTSVNSLKVQADGWDKAFTWNFVRPIHGAVNQRRQRTPRSAEEGAGPLQGCWVYETEEGLKKFEISQQDGKLWVTFEGQRGRLERRGDGIEAQFNRERNQSPVGAIRVRYVRTHALFTLRPASTLEWDNNSPETAAYPEDPDEEVVEDYTWPDPRDYDLHETLLKHVQSDWRYGSESWKFYESYGKLMLKRGDHDEYEVTRNRGKTGTTSVCWWAGPVNHVAPSPRGPIRRGVEESTTSEYGRWQNVAEEGWWLYLRSKSYLMASWHEAASKVLGEPQPPITVARKGAAVPSCLRGHKMACYIDVPEYYDLGMEPLRCDNCLLEELQVHTFYWHCKLCGFDLCEDCAQAAKSDALHGLSVRPSVLEVETLTLPFKRTSGLKAAKDGFSSRGMFDRWDGLGGKGDVISDTDELRRLLIVQKTSPVGRSLSVSMRQLLSRMSHGSRASKDRTSPGPNMDLQEVGSKVSLVSSGRSDFTSAHSSSKRTDPESQPPATVTVTAPPPAAVHRTSSGSGAGGARGRSSERERRGSGSRFSYLTGGGAAPRQETVFEEPAQETPRGSFRDERDSEVYSMPSRTYTMVSGGSTFSSLSAFSLFSRQTFGFGRPTASILSSLPGLSKDYDALSGNLLESCGGSSRRLRMDSEMPQQSLGFDVSLHPAVKSEAAMRAFQRLRQEVDHFWENERENEVVELTGLRGFRATPAPAFAAREALNLLKSKLIATELGDEAALAKIKGQLQHMSVAVVGKGRKALIYKLLRISGHEVTPWFEHMAATLMSTKAREDWQRLDPFVSEARLDVMHQLIILTMLYSTRLGHVRRAVSACDRLSAILQRIAFGHVTEEISAQVEHAASALAGILKTRRVYMDEELGFDPRYLCFEFASDLILQPPQYQLVEEISAKLRDTKDAKREGELLVRALAPDGNPVSPRQDAYEYLEEGVIGEGWYRKTSAIVKQLGVGAGKTSVVSALLCLMLSAGESLVVQVAPPGILELSRSTLRSALSNVVRKRIVTFSCHRTTDVDQGTVQCLERAASTREVVICTPTSLKCVVLKLLEGLHCIPVAQGNAEKVLLRQVKHCARIAQVMRQGSVIMDDVEVVLHSQRTELSFPLEARVPVDLATGPYRLRWKIAWHLLVPFDLIQHLQVDNDASKDSPPGRRLKLPAEVEEDPKAVRLLRALASRMNLGMSARMVSSSSPAVLLQDRFYFTVLLPILAEWAMLFLARAVPTMDQTSAGSTGITNRAIVKMYITRLCKGPYGAVGKAGASGGEDLEELVRRAFSEALPLQLLNLVAEWLAVYLPHCLKKVNRVTYGLTRSAAINGESLKLAVPFLGMEKPANGARFSHPDISIGLTALAYLHEGLRLSDMKEALGRAKRELDFQVRQPPVDDERPAEQLYRNWVEECDGEISAKAWEAYLGRSDRVVPALADVDMEDKVQLERLHKLLSTCPSLIAWYLFQMVCTESEKMQPVEIAASGQDLGGEMLFARRVGFSGTATEFLPLGLGQFHFKKGDTGAVLQTLLNERTCTVVQVKPRQSSDNSGPQTSTRLMQGQPSQMSLDVLDQVVALGADALIDTGALVIGMSNKEVANYILSRWSHAPTAAEERRKRAATFVDEDNAKMVLMAETGSFISEADCQVPLMERFAFYDQPHTLGTDIHHDRFAHAVLTIGSSTTFREFVQGAYRMRMLGTGQRLSIVVWPEIEATMKEELRKANRIMDWDQGARLGLRQKDKLRDVLAWLVVNSAKEEQQQLDKLQLQRAESIWRTPSFRKILSSVEAASGYSTHDAEAEEIQRHVRVFLQPVRSSIPSVVPQRRGLVEAILDRREAVESTLLTLEASTMAWTDMDALYNGLNEDLEVVDSCKIGGVEITGARLEAIDGSIAVSLTGVQELLIDMGLRNETTRRLQPFMPKECRLVFRLKSSMSGDKHLVETMDMMSGTTFGAVLTAAHARQAGTTSIEQGDLVQVMLSRGRAADKWPIARVRGAGRLPGTYNVHVLPEAEDGVAEGGDAERGEELPDISRKFLRKVQDRSTVPGQYGLPFHPQPGRRFMQEPGSRQIGEEDGSIRWADHEGPLSLEVPGAEMPAAQENEEAEDDDVLLLLLDGEMHPEEFEQQQEHAEAPEDEQLILQSLSRQDEYPKSWQAGGSLAPSRAERNLGQFEDGLGAHAAFFPAKKLKLRRSAPLAFPEYLLLSRNFYRPQVTGAQRLRSCSCLLEWVPNTRWAEDNSRALPDEIAGVANKVPKELVAGGGAEECLARQRDGFQRAWAVLAAPSTDAPPASARDARVAGSVIHDVVQTCFDLSPSEALAEVGRFSTNPRLAALRSQGALTAVGSLLGGQGQSTTAAEEADRYTVAQQGLWDLLAGPSHRKTQRGRFYVALSLAEAETLRRILHGRRGRAFADGALAALRLRCADTPMELASTSNFNEGPRHQSQVVQQCLRFIGGQTNFGAKEEALLMQGLPLSSSAARASWAFAAATCSRKTAPCEADQVQMLSGMENEFHLFYWRSLAVQFRKALNTKLQDLTLEEAFQRFDWDASRTLTPEKMWAAVRMLRISDDPAVALEHFAAMDANKDGLVSFDEFTRFVERAGGRSRFSTGVKMVEGAQEEHIISQVLERREELEEAAAQRANEERKRGEEAEAEQTQAAKALAKADREGLEQDADQNPAFHGRVLEFDFQRGRLPSAPHCKIHDSDAEMMGRCRVKDDEGPFGQWKTVISLERCPLRIKPSDFFQCDGDPSANRLNRYSISLWFRLQRPLCTGFAVLLHFDPSAGEAGPSLCVDEVGRLFFRNLILPGTAHKTGALRGKLHDSVTVPTAPPLEPGRWAIITIAVDAAIGSAAVWVDGNEALRVRGGGGVTLDGPLSIRLGENAGFLILGAQSSVKSGSPRGQVRTMSMQSVAWDYSAVLEEHRRRGVWSCTWCRQVSGAPLGERWQDRVCHHCKSRGPRSVTYPGADNKRPGLTVVTADSFQHLVIDADAHTFLLVEASWSNQPAAARGEWAKLARLLQGCEEVSICLMRADAQELDPELLGPAPKLPLYKLFPRGRKHAPILFEDDQPAVPNFLAFLERETGAADIESYLAADFERYAEQHHVERMVDAASRTLASLGPSDAVEQIKAFRSSNQRPALLLRWLQLYFQDRKDGPDLSLSFAGHSVREKPVDAAVTTFVRDLVTSTLSLALPDSPSWFLAKWAMKDALVVTLPSLRLISGNQIALTPKEIEQRQGYPVVQKMPTASPSGAGKRSLALAWNVVQPALQSAKPLAEGHLAPVAKEVEQGLFMDSFFEGRAMVHWACGYGNVELLEFLMANGADIHKQSEDGALPIEVAAVRGHDSCLRLLLDHGSLVGRALHLSVMAGELTTTRTLIRAKVPVGAQAHGLRPVELAAWSGRSDMVEFLIENNASVAAAVDRAACEVLVPNAEALMQLRYPDTSHLVALLGGAREVMASKVLRARGMLDPLERAELCAVAKPTMCCVLHERYFACWQVITSQFGMRQSSAETPGAAAAKAMAAILEEAQETERRILVNARNPSGWTLLMVSPILDSHDDSLVKLLLKNRADVNVEDAHGKTATFWASWFQAAPALEQLKQVGAQLTDEDNQVAERVRSIIGHDDFEMECLSPKSSAPSDHARDVWWILSQDVRSIRSVGSRAVRFVELTRQTSARMRTPDTAQAKQPPVVAVSSGRTLKGFFDHLGKTAFYDKDEGPKEFLSLDDMLANAKLFVQGKVAAGSQDSPKDLFVLFVTLSSCAMFRKVNKFLQDFEDQEWSDLANPVMQALLSLPAEEVTVFRGTRLPRSELIALLSLGTTASRRVTWHGLPGCSLDRAVAEQGCSGVQSDQEVEVLYEVKACSARNVSRFTYLPELKDVILLPEGSTSPMVNLRIVSLDRCNELTGRWEALDGSASAVFQFDMSWLHSAPLTRAEAQEVRRVHIVLEELPGMHE